jgi:chromosome segregation ATPase
MVKKRKEKKDKILKALEDISAQIKEQFISIRKELDERDSRLARLKSELNSIKAEVMKVSLNVKAFNAKVEKIEQKIDTAIINHESRTRELERKSGVQRKDESESLKYSGYYFV